MEEVEDTSAPSSVRSSELGPIRTGREVPGGNLSPPLSITESNISDEVVRSSQEPLPPIGSSQSQDLEIGIATSSVIGSTMAGSNSRESSKRPKITQSFRREIESEPLPTTETRSDQGLSKQDKLTVTIETQTEWSWLEDMQMMKKSKAAKMSAKSDGTTSDEDNESILDNDLDDVDKAGPESTIAPEMKGVKPKTAESRRGLESEMTFASESSIPYPPKDDEYGIPILHLSSESEDSDDESEILYQRDDEEEDVDEAGVLPTIGPPEILKYQKESEKKAIDVNAPEDRLLTDEDMAAAEALKNQSSGGVFEGVCEFCGNPIKPFPTMDDQKYKAPEDLYCCNDYQEFVLFMVKHPIQEEHTADKMIDIKPHPPFGSKQARRAAKEKAMARMREREMQRQQAAMAAAGVGGGGGGGANYYQFARQMKTINYQLSSQKCMEEGWTIRPPTPPEELDNINDIFEPEPVLPPWAEAEGKVGRDLGLILKYYEDGRPFVILFSDGTGSVFYHSGRHAITITSTDPGLFTYIIQEDTEQSDVMAVFEPNGCGCTYYTNGMVRLQMDQIGGTELDAYGVRKKKWSWKDWKQTHVHAPPLQPITCAITPQVGLRIMTQEHISLTFTCRSRSARFQVGTRLKLLSKLQAQSDIDEDELYRQEVTTRVQSLFDKVANLLKFPNSPKLNKLPTPGHLTSRVQKLERIREQQHERKTKKHPPVVTVN